MRHLHVLYPSLDYSRNMCAILDRMPRNDGILLPFVDDRAKDVQIVPRDGSDTVALLFCGRWQRLGLPLALIHRWLGLLPCSLVYLRDIRDMFYLTGVQSLGPSPEAACAELRRVIATLGARRVVCYGSSSGVYGALLYGLMLEAESVLCMAGATCLAGGLGDLVRNRVPMETVRRQLPAAMLDLRQVYAAASSCPPVRIVFGQDSRADRMHAEHMASLPGVVTHALEGCSDHNIVTETIIRGKFDELLQWLVSSARPKVGTLKPH